MFYIYIIKRFLEDIFLFPLILIGHILYKRLSFFKEYKIIFFFPFYHMGGAEKVHAQVTMAVGNSNCLIIFTKKSQNNLFLEQFKKSNCAIIDISKYTDNKWIYLINIIYRGIISANINKQKNKPIVFNGQSNFGYKISKWINKSIPQIELIHSFNSFSWIRLPFISFYTKTIMISKKRIQDHLHQYKKLHVPKDFYKKIIYIPNGIKIPIITSDEKISTQKIKILYVGRGSVEKRIYLIAKMINYLHPLKNIEFEFVGDVANFIPKYLHKYCKFYGNINNQTILNNIYQQANALILTSNGEGFPMVVMEAMANGCSIIATPVGDIPIHVNHGINGFLFTSIKNENTIVSEGIFYIKKLLEDKFLLKEIEKNNIQYAKHNFGIDLFNKRYNELVKQYKSDNFD